MFLLYPLCLIPALLLALVVAFADSAFLLGAFGLYTFRHPGDLAFLVLFTLPAAAIASLLTRRVERGRALRRPFWRRHLHYCIALYLLAAVLSPALACGIDAQCAATDGGLRFVAALCALLACAVQALALFSVRRHVRLPRASIAPIHASTV